MPRRSFLFLALIVFAPQAFLAAAEPAPDRSSGLAKAVERGIAVLEKAGKAYPTHRKCFACHHQTMPLLAITAARGAGIATDDKLPTELRDFAAASFRSRIDDLNKGEGIGGKGLTVGYGLWTLRLAGTEPDLLTQTMVAYLLLVQEPDGHWGLHSIRPPGEESLVMCTVLAASGLKHFATTSQRTAADAALEKAQAWLATAPLESHEDRVARLWGLVQLGGSPADRAAARKVLLDAQRADGGWSQLPDAQSDAYATGTAMYVLLADRSAEKSGPSEKGTPTDSAIESVEKSLIQAADFLLKSQLEDGSWHVVTRAKPVQVFFDNGDPHGKDQFVSISATGWSTAALARIIADKLSPPE